MNRIVCILTLIFTGLAQGTEIDYLALTEILLRDKNYNRAQLALKNARDNWDDIEEEHYYLLNGLYLLRTENPVSSITELLKVKDRIYLDKKQIYLSEAYLELGQKRKALEEIEKVKLRNKTPISVKHLKSKIFFENGKYQEALELLSRLFALKEDTTLRLAIHYLGRLGLFEEALRVYREFRDPRKIKTQSLLVSRLFESFRQRQKAIVVLEEAAIFLPMDVQILNSLAFFYHLENKVYVAGDIYTKVAYIDISLAYEVGEYLRQHGRAQQAHILNMNVTDQRKQILQKLSIYIDEKKYDMARALEVPLKQIGAFDDDEIKYAFAYVLLSQGEYRESIHWIKNIKKKSLMNKSLKLLKMADDCLQDGWECYGYF